MTNMLLVKLLYYYTCSHKTIYLQARVGVTLLQLGLRICHEQVNRAEICVY